MYCVVAYYCFRPVEVAAVVKKRLLLVSVLVSFTILVFFIVGLCFRDYLEWTDSKETREDKAKGYVTFLV